MASDNEAFCVSDPNFAVICSFLECFGKSCGIDYPDIATLQKMLEDSQEVPQPLVDLHIKLLRKTRKSVSSEKWERALVKFCHTYSNQDGWELERFGYKKARIGVKLRLLKVLLESQFDLNQKFKNEVNKLAAKELRVEPLGRDKTGLAYWFQLDEGCNIRVYREDVDEESWELVANDREGVVKLINTLTDGEIGPIPINEDSNSIEISEKPIIDTGQVSTSSPSVDDGGGGGSGGDGTQENGDKSNSKNQIQLNNKNIKKEDLLKSSDKKMNKKIINESDNSDEGSEDDEEDDDDDDEEEDVEDEEELSNGEEEEASKHNTEEEDDEEDEDEEDESQDAEGGNDKTVAVAATVVVAKATSNQLQKPIKGDDYIKRKTVVTCESENVEKEIAKTSVIKPIISESTQLKSIETPVITTSPLKLVNITELKHTMSDRMSNVALATPVSKIKSSSTEDSISSPINIHDKISTKNLLPLTDSILSHGKFPIKPIDQLAANLVRIQSEKLEKPSASKLLEQIAENLARSSSAHGSSLINGDDDKFLSDFSARNQVEKLNLMGNARNSRGIDLSTSPRGWENANDHNRPMDFSGIDLSSRKTSATIIKPTDLPSPGYRTQEFQYREMDLSTRKVTKTELPNLPYDSRSTMLRNHTMVTDLSKRQMPFINYDMPSVAAAAAAAAAYHSGGRIPAKDEPRLANYAILPDPSKLASMRSGAVKRPLESVEDPQQEKLKRLRADLIPMRSTIDKKSTIVGAIRRNDIGPAIEEPLMMVHGEGSGSDCDAGNPEVGEAIEESVIFFYGEGNGHDCDTGNPGDETSTGDKDSSESKDEGCSEISAALSQTKVTDDNDTDVDSNVELDTTKTDTGIIAKSPPINSDCTESNTTMSTTSNCLMSDVATTSESTKMKFKPSLGVQVIAKTMGPPMKRFSRWDVGAPEEKRECDSSIISNEENISLESSVKDAGCHCEKDTTTLTANLPSEDSRLEIDAITSTTNQSLSATAANTSPLSAENKISTDSEIQCDSSSVEPMEVESTIREKRSELRENIKIEESHCDPTDETPRFFFGPNCVSYTPTTTGKENIEQVATSSSTIDCPKSETGENTCQTDSNNSVKSVDVPVAGPESVLAEADDGSSEEVNCDNDIPTELLSATEPSESMNISIDEGPSVSNNNKEISGDLKLRIEEKTEKREEIEEKKDMSKSKQFSENQPTTTVATDVPESSTALSTYPEDERGENESTLTPATPDEKLLDEGVTNSECDEIEKFNVKVPEVTTIVESTSLVNEVCSTSTTDDSIGDKSAESNVKIIDSSNAIEELKIEPVESSSVDHGEDSSKIELEEAAPESTVDEAAMEVEGIAVITNREEQDHKVESSIEDGASCVEIQQNLKMEENAEEKNQSCDTSAPEPINESISIQDSSAEAVSSNVADSSAPKTLQSDAFCDDFSDNQTNSVDQDSNEPMVIDDRTSDSSESAENLITETIEKSPDCKSEIPDSNTSETNIIIEKSTSEVVGECSNSLFINVGVAAIPEENLKPSEKADTNSEQSGREEMEKITETCMENISLSNEKEPESVVSTMNKDVDKSSESSFMETSTFNDDSTKPSLVSQASLVANYDSNESNDACSDDLCHADSVMEIDSQDVEEPTITESKQTSPMPVESPAKIETAEPEATTSMENIPMDDSEIVKEALLAAVPSEMDNNKLEKVKEVEESIIEAVIDPVVEEHSIDSKSSETVKESLIEESNVQQTNEEICGADKNESILEKEDQESKNITEQPITEIISEKSSQPPEVKLSELDIPEPTKHIDDVNQLLESIPEKIEKVEEIKQVNAEKPHEELVEDVTALGGEYSKSNSPAYTDEDDDNDEPPIVQVSKRPKTDMKELPQSVLENPTSINALPKNEELSNETEHESEYNTPPTSIVAPITKSDKFIKKIQIGEKPGIAILDDTSRIPFIKENIQTKIKSVCENSPSISMKESLEEFKPSMNANVITNVADSVQEDTNAEPRVYIKTDVKNEASKMLHRAIDLEDPLPLFKSKPIDIDCVKDEPQTLANDIKCTSDVKPIDIIDKTLNTSIESITALTLPVLQCEKQEIEIKCEETKPVRSDNISEIKQNDSEQIHENIVITDLSNAKPVEDDYDIDSDDSMGVDNECIFESAENNVGLLEIKNDDLAEQKMDLDNTEEKLGIRVKPMNDIQYEGWKLDSTEPMTPPQQVSRKRRNSGHETNSEDGTEKQDDDLEEMAGGKRIKLRGKRTPELTLRKTVENSRADGASSDDEVPAIAESLSSILPDPSQTEEIKKDVTATTIDPFKPKSKAKGRRRRGFRSKRRASHHKKLSATSSAAEPPVLNADGTPIDDASESTPTARKKRKKRKMVLGLEIGIDIPLPDSQSALDETPVRQSRRIAQIKIKEEADRRRIEEEALGEMKEKKERDVADKKKRKKTKGDSDDDPPVKCDVREEREVKLKKKRKKRKKEAKFNEAKPWQSSSGSSTEDEKETDEDFNDEDDIESEESLLFKSDHEFSPESDLEKDAETEPMRRARTAQKLQNDVEETEDEYACQKCGKADHPEWILLCDTCDKGWHCSCLRPALMLIPEGDWFCPPCQHNLLVNKLRDSLKTYDQLAKRYENEILRKKRLAFVGISLDNVLQKNDANRHHRSSRLSSRDDDDSDDDGDDDDDAASNVGSSSSSESSDSGNSESGSCSEESEPVYQLRERRCANTYKFNEYDDMINAAIQDEVEAVQGAGNQGRGKDISTIVNAEKEDTQVEAFDKQMEEEDDEDKPSDKDSDKELSKDADYTDNEDHHKSLSSKKLLSRKKHRKLNSLDISSEDDPDSDEDFKGASSDEDEDYDDQLLSSDDSSFTESRRRGKKNSRPVRRSTRAARKTRYDEDFINDDSDESDRPKRKKSKSTWDESESEESDNSWRSRKKKSRPSAMPRLRTSVKSKSKNKKKRKRIIEPDNQSDNENEEEEAIIEEEKKTEDIETSQDPAPIEQPIKEHMPIVEQPVPILELTPEPLNPDNDDDNDDDDDDDDDDGEDDDDDDDDDNNDDDNDDEINKIAVDEGNENENHAIPQDNVSKPEFTTNYPIPTPTVVEEDAQKRERLPKQKKTPIIRRKIIYGGLPDDRPQQQEEPLGRRTRGRKINYQVDTIMSDSEEELKKALRKTEESEDEFVVHDRDDFHDDGDKDSDSGDIYSPKKDTPKGKHKSPKNRRTKKSPGGKSMIDDSEPKQRKKPGPKPGSKNKPRQPKTMMSPLEGGVIGDVAEGSLASLGTSELAELDDEQLEQMMMEDEEYGRRQLELAAIEIAKNKKKEEREAKKLEKARLKALEILAAEQQRDPNAPEGLDGEAPKKKKRGRRSKAEILADQMRRDGAPHLGGGLTSSPNIPTIVPPSLTIVNPALSTMPVIMMPSDVGERPPAEGQMPMITGPDGQLFNPDGTPMKPKRRGRGKGKKTLALEAARAAEAAAKATAEAGGLGLTVADVNSELKHDDIPNVLPTPGSSTSGSAPSTPPAIAVTSQGLPPPPPSQSSNPQSVYPQLPPSQQSSVITRMLQSQPVSTAPQSFTAAAAAMGQKYFGVPNATSQMMGGPRPAYDMSPRGRIPSPYNSRQTGQPPPMPPHFAAVRSGTPPMRMRVPGPTQLYHTPHHPMDPSPSGGGPISISSRDRSSPLGPGPAMIPPAASSPLAKGGPTPPPYVRGGPPLSRFTDNPQLGSRHQLPPFTSASPANHTMQQPSPPPIRPGNFSPYHPQPPPNYHYGAYPPPAPMPTADDAAAYQGSPYSAEHFSTSAENPPPIQPPTPQSTQPQPPPPSTQQQHPPPHPNEPVHGPGKQYDEEGTGEFGGLVSYFSSQREDDLDS